MIRFTDSASALEAMEALQGTYYGGTQLQVSLYREKKAATDAEEAATITNVLFCRQVYGVTPTEFNKAFEGFEGFYFADLCQCSNLFYSRR